MNYLLPDKIKKNIWFKAFDNHYFKLSIINNDFYVYRISIDFDDIIYFKISPFAQFIDLNYIKGLNLIKQLESAIQNQIFI